MLESAATAAAIFGISSLPHHKCGSFVFAPYSSTLGKYGGKCKSISLHVEVWQTEPIGNVT